MTQVADDFIGPAGPCRPARRQRAPSCATAKVEGHKVRALKLLAEGHRILLGAVDEGGLYSDICRAVVGLAGYRLASVGVADDDGFVQPIAVSGAPVDFVLKSHMRWDDGPLGQGPTGSAIRTGQTKVNRNFLTDEGIAPWRDDALAAGLRSSIAIPLKFANGRVASLTIYSAERGAFPRAEMRLLEQLAADIVHGVDGIRARQASQTAAVETEHHNRLMSGLMDICPLGLVVYDTDNRVLLFNQKYARTWGVSGRAITGKTLGEMAPLLAVHTIDPEGFEATVKETAEKNATVHHFASLKDGRFVDLFSAPVSGAGGERIGRVTFVRDITGDRIVLANLKRINRLLTAFAAALVLLCCLLFAWPHLTRAINGPRSPDVFGSTALKVRYTPLDENWALVADVSPPATPTVAALEDSLRGGTTLQKIKGVNTWVNHAIRYRSDPPGTDHWATLSESLREGEGDCEDYAIGKMQLLKALGVPAADIYLVIAKDLIRHADHALLAVQVDGQFWILDNGADEVLSQETVKDYRPIFTFAAGGKWVHGYQTAKMPISAVPASSVQ